MKSKFIVSLSAILLSMNIFSQEKLPLSLEDLLPGGKTYSAFRPEMPRGLTFYGDQLTYTKGDSIFVVSAKNKDHVLLDVKSLNEGFGEEIFKSLPRISFPYGDKPVAKLEYKGDIFLYDFGIKKKIASYTVPKEAENNTFSPQSQTIAYTKDNNLYILTKEGKEIAITAETDREIVSGQSVHRNEFGIKNGIFWSPKGTRLAFYRMDQTMVSDYPLVDASARVAALNYIKYPMAGMKSHQVTIGIFDPTNQKTVFLKTGVPKEKYLTNIAWSPDEKGIYVAELNRGQDTLELNRYNPLTGILEAKLFTEVHSKYVEPENPVQFLKNNPNQFIWLSRRDGFNHFYLYEMSGKLIKQLTSGKWEVTSIVGFDEKGENLVYTSNEESPIENHLYKVNLKTGKRSKLTQEKGVHNVELSLNGKTVSDVYTSQYNPGKVAEINVSKSTVRVFHEAKDPFRHITLPEITLGSLKASDGRTDLYYRLVKPLNFDPVKKYPVVIYVYGGPHSQLVTNAWQGQARGWDIYMAEKGYIVFTLDNRGTSNRGLNFENVTHRHLGVVETEDQMAGVNYLKSLPYVDVERIGVHGWSFGGFMTLNLMLRHPETFKVGVAGGPVTDWKYYEIMYGERYMDRPQENAEGYEESNMVEKAGNLRGRLLIIHGDQDPTVVPQHSIQFLRSSVAHGTHPDFFIYPGHEHNVLGPDRIHLHEQITRYFDDFLK
jgi:dipeptidyl-peptidase-4